jgi:hypothetical protein
MSDEKLAAGKRLVRDGIPTLYRHLPARKSAA